MITLTHSQASCDLTDPQGAVLTLTDPRGGQFRGPVAQFKSDAVISQTARRMAAQVQTSIKVLVNKHSLEGSSYGLQLVLRHVPLAEAEHPAVSPQYVRVTNQPTTNQRHQLSPCVAIAYVRIARRYYKHVQDTVARWRC